MAKKAAVEKVVEKLLIDPDQALTEHLGKAEEHLIKALQLFEREVKPERHKDFVSRLTRAQELVTWLYREELIRIRGPIKVAVVKRKK
jgi:hypothetical protein